MFERLISFVRNLWAPKTVPMRNRIASLKARRLEEQRIQNDPTESHRAWAARALREASRGAPVPAWAWAREKAVAKEQLPAWPYLYKKDINELIEVDFPIYFELLDQDRRAGSLSLSEYRELTGQITIKE